MPEVCLVALLPDCAFVSSTGASRVVGDLANGGSGFANEAVEDNIGVAKDDETTAGTEADLIIFALRAVRSATFVSRLLLFLAFAGGLA